MFDVFVIEDVDWEPTSVEIFLRNYVAGIPGADTPFRVKSVLGMVGAIQSYVISASPYTGGLQSIRQMFIAGHGSAGEQSVGAGDASDPTGAKVLKGLPSGKLMGQAALCMPILLPYFAPNAVITLGGCEAASGPKGDFLLKAMSATLGGIAVQGGTSNQCSFKGPSGSVKRCTNGVVKNLGSCATWPGPTAAGPAPVTGVGAVTSAGVTAVTSGGVSAVGSR